MKLHDPIVSAEWVAEHHHDTGMVLVDATLPPVGVHPQVDTRARYLQQHLPGAVFFDIDELSDHASGLPHTMPSAASFAAAMGRLGIADSMTIVVYEQAGVFSAPRALWMLRTFGAANVRLLDGGLQAWLQMGYPTQSGEVVRTPATFHASVNRAAITTYPQLLEKLQAHQQVLDARSSGRFLGTAPEPRPGLSSGHMPGATSVPFLDLVSADRLKSPVELQALFRDKNIDLHAPITTTCGSGVTAAVVLLALEIAGAPQLSLYDGSWAEYAQQPDAVIVK